MVTRTRCSTQDETLSGTSSEEEEEEEEEYLPPCRSAALAIVSCPLCGRQVTAKTLRYSHKCGRSFCVEERAEEHRKLAEIAVLSRMGQVKKQQMVHKQQSVHPIERRMEPLLENIPIKPNKYDHLFKLFPQ